VLYGLGDARDTRGLGSELLSSLKDSAHLPKNVDSLVGTFRKVNFALPSKQSIDKAFNLQTTNPGKFE
jgi:hypothetical protein